jgi:hypothetical protein
MASAATVQDLLYGSGGGSCTNYDLRRHATQKARINFETAGIAYEAHLEQHRCGGELREAGSVSLPAQLPIP